MGEGSFKAAKGLIKTNVQVYKQTILSIQISGDFFMYPEDSLWELQHELKGITARKDHILEIVQQFFQQKQISTPGVTAEDFTEAILRGIANTQ
jgi:lipoate-protein ligase A